MSTLKGKDKGITKLEKFFKERGAAHFEDHIQFLRTLQNLRSTSAAHRKGSNYEKLIEDLQLIDEGAQKVFEQLLLAGITFTRFVSVFLIPPEQAVAK